MNLRTLTALGLGCLVLAACSATNTDGAASAPGTAPLVASSSGPRVTERTVTISLLGTNDLHGRVLALPLLAGYVANVRAARAADGGGVVLVDAGDMFQGTLESNLPEGAPVPSLSAIELQNAAAADALDLGPPVDAPIWQERTYEAWPAGQAALLWQALGEAWARQGNSEAAKRCLARARAYRPDFREPSAD